MKDVYILISEDVVLSSAAGPLDMLARCNDILTDMAKSPAFNVQLVSEKFKNVFLGEAAQFMCQKTLGELPPGSSGHHRPLIIVPALKGDWDDNREKYRATIEWLKAHYAKGTEIASLCVGSYFLAEASLLEGKPCTSHWRAAADLQQRFPTIKLQPDAVLTDQDGIYTGGGAFASLNLILYLIEKFCGHEVGVHVAKNFSIHRDHINQAHFSAFRGLNQHGDEFVLRAQRYIEEHFDQHLSVDDVADRVSMSKRNFIRRFKKATHYTPLDYIQRVKIEAVKNALENSNRSVQSLMLEVGYNDGKSFREVFKRITGVTPQEYRNKYAAGYAGF